jgi:GMP synthase (glutamine-hydrolysing)
MKPPVVLIIKTGSTYADLKNLSGDFEDWIRTAAGERHPTWKVKPVANVEPDKIPHYQGIIITGSHSSLTQFYTFYSGMERVMEQIVAHRVPTLGICFGHQLIHKIMGGQISLNPLGTEMGVVSINLTMNGLTDPLFKGQRGSKIPVYASHTDIVLRSAPDFIQLAWNELSQYQATRYENYIYTVQFHPEYDRNIMAYYLSKNLPLLTKQYLRNPLHFQKAEVILKNNKNLSKSALIIQNFLRLVTG